MDLQKKVFVTDIKEIDDNDMTITATISTGAVDRQRESLDPDGVDLAHYRKNSVVLWAHDYSTPPIGRAMWVKKTADGVIAKVKFYSSDKVLGEFSKEIYQMYKQKFLNAFSVGFIPKETKEASDKDWNDPKKPRRTFTKWDMIEFSAVPVPANPEALQLALEKGEIKSPMWKTLLEKKENEVVQEFSHEELEANTSGSAEVKIINIKSSEDDNHLFEDLIAENSLLQEQIEGLEKDNQDLRLKLYQSLKTNQERRSEITAQDAVKIFEDVARGVIRKAQGKLD